MNMNIYVDDWKILKDIESKSDCKYTLSYKSRVCQEKLRSFNAANISRLQYQKLRRSRVTSTVCHARLRLGRYEGLGTEALPPKGMKSFFLTQRPCNEHIEHSEDVIRYGIGWCRSEWLSTCQYMYIKDIYDMQNDGVAHRARCSGLEDWCRQSPSRPSSQEAFEPKRNTFETPRIALRTFKPKWNMTWNYLKCFKEEVFRGGSRCVDISLRGH